MVEEESPKAQKFMKVKVRLVKAEKQNPQHQMMFIPTKEYPLQKILVNKTKVLNENVQNPAEEKCSKPSRYQSHHI